MNAIERGAQALYDAWRSQYPGPVEGTCLSPRWFALREDLKQYWLDVAAEAFARADAEAEERRAA